MTIRIVSIKSFCGLNIIFHSTKKECLFSMDFHDDVDIDHPINDEKQRRILSVIVHEHGARYCFREWGLLLPEKIHSLNLQLREVFVENDTKLIIRLAGIDARIIFKESRGLFMVGEKECVISKKEQKEIVKLNDVRNKQWEKY